MGGADEEWVKAAMTDDTMVVELLVRLQRTGPPRKRAALPLEWSVRQRRSKSVSVTNNPKKKPVHRGSPTTPLSWSGATSLSGGSGGVRSGGFEESSRPPLFKPSNTARSKINGDGEKNASKKSRKKKTLAELKEEENMLVKERKELNKEIAALRRNLEKQRATNESFKRIKLELQPKMDTRTAFLLEESICGQHQQKTTAGHPTPTPSISPPIVSGDVITRQPSASNGWHEQNGDASSTSKFSLPDLNIPFEDSVSDAVCGVS